MSNRARVLAARNTCGSTQLRLACLNPVNSTAADSNSTKFAVATAEQRPQSAEKLCPTPSGDMRNKLPPDRIKRRYKHYGSNADLDLMASKKNQLTEVVVEPVYPATLPRGLFCVDLLLLVCKKVSTCRVKVIECQERDGAVLFSRSKKEAPICRAGRKRATLA